MRKLLLMSLMAGIVAMMLAPDLLISKTNKLYVVTRSTKKFRIGSQENPTVGLFSTSDQGKNWRHYGWQYLKCFSVAIAEKQIFYLACGNGVLKSKDGGKSWAITSGETITECLKIAIDPENSDCVYAATAYGIFKTMDGGRTWQEKNRGLTSTFTPVVLIDREKPQQLYCATESGIHRSDNGGELWQPIALLGLGIRTIVQHPAQPNYLLAGTEDDGVFLSQDHGKTWQQKINGLAHKTVYALTFAPQNPRILYAGTFRGGIYKSTDGGDSWQSVNNNLGNPDIHALLVDPSDERTVYAGTLNDGVWLSQDAGANWRFIGLETSQVWDMVIVR